MLYTVFDIETDGLEDEVTKIHCLCFVVLDDSFNVIRRGVLTKYKDIKKLVLEAECLVGHNIVDYDIPVIVRFTKITEKIKARIICTLALSFKLYPVASFEHGLDAWGGIVGIKKKEVTDWVGQELKVYVDRCKSDVEINIRMFKRCYNYLLDICSGDAKLVGKHLGYATFKMVCLTEQKDEGIKLDMPKVLKHRNTLEMLHAKQHGALSCKMPKVLDKEFKAPSKPFKKDGTLSVVGQRWKDKMEQFGLPFETQHVYKQGNPGSPAQLKAWLYSYGWEPDLYKQNKKNEEVAQVNKPFGAGLTDSVKQLIKQYPELAYVGVLAKTTHRLGLIKGFQEHEKDGFIAAGAFGFTNTMRMQHKKPVCNLPRPTSWFGAEIRECLTVPSDEYEMIGSDLSGIEDATKRHYIYPYDPKYVEEMNVPDFDAHIDIGVLAGLMSKDEADFFKGVNKRLDAGENVSEEDLQKLKPIKKKRADAKTCNFMLVYGGGIPLTAKTLKCDLEYATKLHTTYWNRNKAVKQIAADALVNEVHGQLWVYNPIAGMWYFLKNEKDIFSTLNQSSAVYVFDLWLKFCMAEFKKLGVRVCLQYHDSL